ncbi:hypothetical protein CON64_08840 [Bacillus pseudomycoides]|nr:hypothetical protein CON64_08840 [Bacillus pseudomycoides]
MWFVLRKDRDLCIYFLGRFISNLGNHFSFFAQSIAAYMFTNTLSSVGLLWIIRGVASLLTIPVGGIAADLYNRKKIILFTDIASAATSFCFIFLNSSNYILLLLILSFISQTINRFFDPAAKASFKQISSQTPLYISNSCSAILGQITILLGPLLASSIYTITSGNIQLLFILDALSFLISFICIYFVQFGAQEKQHQVPFHINVLQGFQYVFIKKDLLYILLFMAPIAFGGKVFEVLVLELSNRYWSTIKLGSMGIYLAIFAAGGILGATQVSKYRGQLNNKKAYIKFISMSGILFFLLSVPSPFLSIIATFLLGITFNISVVLAQIYIQHSCEEQYLGRVFATWTLLAVLGGGIGAYLSGLLYDLFDLNIAFFVTGLCMLLPFFITFLWTFYHRQQQKKIGM